MTLATWLGVAVGLLIFVWWFGHHSGGGNGPEMYA